MEKPIDFSREQQSEKNEFENIVNKGNDVIDDENGVEIRMNKYDDRTDDNRKETPEEQKQRLYEENIKNKFNDIVNKAGNNSNKNLINNEEFEIYKKYRKIRKPNINYEIKKVPTYGSVKKYDETYPQKKS